MSVEAILEKMTEHNSDVLGCIAMADDRTWSNLPDLYDVIDRQAISEHAMNLFQVTDGLETDHDPFDQLFLEFESHSFYVRRLDDVLLLLLNKPMRRTHFKKMQVGVNLFLKPLQRAIADDGSSAKAPLVATPTVPDTTPPPEKGRRYYRGTRY